MKVITIKQPWATLIAKGYKEYEFRTWKTNYRGDILIHASKGIDKKAMQRFEYLNLDYPIGCIIAKAKLVDCVYITDDIGIKLYTENPIVYKSRLDKEATDKYGFKLEEVMVIDPIYINGKLGLWNYD